MKLHPEDIRYWVGWFIGFVIILVSSRLFLVNPIIKAIKEWQTRF